MEISALYIAPSSEELRACKEIDQNTLLVHGFRPEYDSGKIIRMPLGHLKRSIIMVLHYGALYRVSYRIFCWGGKIGRAKTCPPRIFL